MKTITCLISLLLLFSCRGKQYKYVETVRVKGIFGNDARQEEKEAEHFYAKSDSEAYCQAFKNFCIALKVKEDMVKTLGSTSSETPVSFKLLTNENLDITEVSFTGKQKKEAEIAKAIASLSSSVQSKSREISTRPLLTTDSVKATSLSKHFRITKDEFSNNDTKWYIPRSSPLYTNANGIYLYFQTIDGQTQNLRLRLQYYSDDWLFFKKVQFNVDGVAYDYYPLNKETDNGDGGHIWEWLDDRVNDGDKALIYALAHGKQAKMKLIGDKYHDTKQITAKQLLAFKQSLEFYIALGGAY
jgi:hypothetical protein